MSNRRPTWSKRATSPRGLVGIVAIQSLLWGMAGHLGLLFHNFASAAPVGAAVAVLGWGAGRLFLWGERGSRFPDGE